MKEFTITFAKDIKGNGADNFATFIYKGHRMKINEETLNKLIAGEKITKWVTIGHGMTGSYSYDKNDLEAEFIETEVIIETRTRRFRQSKIKQ